VAIDATAFLAGDGKGKADRDCYIGLDGYSQADLSPISKNGKKMGIACTDCDPSCDLDGVDTPNGSCTFSIAACVNVPGIEGCDPASRTPKKLSAKAKSKAGKLDLGTTFPGDLSSACSAFVDFPVPVKGKKQNKPGKGKVKLLAKKPTDKDKVTFVCNPRPEGEACPAPTTTSTVMGTTTSTSTTTVTISSTTTSTVVTTTTLVLPIALPIVLPVLTTTTLALPIVLPIISTTTSTLALPIILPIISTTTSTLALPIILPIALPIIAKQEQRTA
jgi:hypothetical protein